MDQTLRDELTRDEGLRLESYQDTVGFWTIGVGHLLGSERRMLRITQFEAEALLAADVQEAERIVFSLLPALGALRGMSFEDWMRVEPVRYRALVNMAFNLGSRLGQFKNTLALVLAEDWQTAAISMLMSKWAKQVGQRAVRLSEMVRTGEVM